MPNVEDVILLIIAAPFIVFVGISLRRGVRALRSASRMTPRRVERRDAPTGGFPVLPPAPGPRPVQEIGGGAGVYRIVGVVAATGEDAELRIGAATPANAKVKAELRGVIVTAVERA